MSSKSGSIRLGPKSLVISLDLIRSPGQGLDVARWNSHSCLMKLERIYDACNAPCCSFSQKKKTVGAGASELRYFAVSTTAVLFHCYVVYQGRENQGLLTLSLFSPSQLRKNCRSELNLTSFLETNLLFPEHHKLGKHFSVNHALKSE